MPEISRDEVAHLATLARIDLSDAELDHLAPQLSVILESVASISEVAGADVPPTSHPLPLTNVFREDVVRPGLSAEEALAGVVLYPNGGGEWDAVERCWRCAEGERHYTDSLAGEWAGRIESTGLQAIIGGCCQTEQSTICALCSALGDAVSLGGAPAP